MSFFVKGSTFIKGRTIVGEIVEPSPTVTPTPTITPSSTPSVIVSDGLTLRLDASNPSSYPGTGTIWFDIAGTQQNITLVNSPTFTSGSTSYFTFNGTNQYGTGTQNVIPTTGYTKSVWFYLNSYIDNNLVSSSIGGHFMFFAATNKLYCGHANWPSYTVFPSVTSFDLNQWYNATLTFDTTNGMTLYVNGIQDSTYTANKSVRGGDGSTNIATFGGGNLLSGRIGKVYTYNRPLTSSEVLENFNADASQFNINITPTPTPTLTPTPTTTPTITTTPTLSITPSITPTRTLTPTPSITPSITPTITTTPTMSITPSITPTISITPSITPTRTLTPTPSITPTITPTRTLTPTPSITPTITPTITLTPSITPTITLTPSVTPTTVTAVTFSQTFTSGQAPTAAVENAWTTFRSQLTGTYSTMTLSNNLGTSLTVTDANVNLIATALRTGTTGTNFSIVIGSRTWRVIQGCVSGTATAVSIYLTSDSVCSCGGVGTYTVRPMIKNANWGGLNTSSCGQPTQTITVTFS